MVEKTINEIKSRKHTFARLAGSIIRLFSDQNDNGLIVNDINRYIAYIRDGKVTARDNKVGLDNLISNNDLIAKIRRKSK